MTETRRNGSLESIVVARHSPLGIPQAIAEQMLPTEHVGFAARPHPIVLVRPLVVLVAILAVLAFALTYHVRPIVAGHHVDVPWLDARERVWALAVAGLAALRVLAWLAKETLYYAGLRIVATNRRVYRNALPVPPFSGAHSAVSSFEVFQAASQASAGSQVARNSELVACGVSAAATTERDGRVFPTRQMRTVLPPWRCIPAGRLQKAGCISRSGRKLEWIIQIRRRRSAAGRRRSRPKIARVSPTYRR